MDIILPLFLSWGGSIRAEFPETGNPPAAANPTADMSSQSPHLTPITRWGLFYRVRNPLGFLQIPLPLVFGVIAAHSSHLPFAPPITVFGSTVAGRPMGLTVIHVYHSHLAFGALPSLRNVPSGMWILSFAVSHVVIQISPLYTRFAHH